MSEPVWVPLGAAPQPGEVELGYVQGTGTLGISGTSEAGASEYLVLPSLTFDGNTPIIVEGYIHSFSSPTGANSSILVNLWDGNTDLGRLLRVTCPGGASPVTVALLGRRRLTPSAGAHVFRLKAWVTTGGGTIDGAPPSFPYYLRVVAPSGFPLASPLAYGQTATDVSVTATTEAAANTVATASAFTADGSPVFVEFSCGYARIDSAAKRMTLWLYDGATPVGLLGSFDFPTANSGYALHAKVRIPAPSGSKTYSVRASVDGGTGTIYSGAGGAGVRFPAFIAVTRAS